MSEIHFNKEAYETVIGLEVHVQLQTKSKIFCSDDSSFTTDANTHVSAITLGHPGTLPKLNIKAIEFAVKMGIACNCEIERYNYFDRKNYFYPDLPKGYQITQNATPICRHGYVSIRINSIEKKIPLHHIHLEEDAGKLLHDQHDADTLVDYSRAGIALIEIVSEPEIHSGEEAYTYLTELRKIVRYLGICDGNMEEGSMRCDANISVRPKGAAALGCKVEIKNMNSIRHVKKAIEYEAERQMEALASGEIILQQTRSFDAQQGITQEMRSKEMANDYRYFPEPDLAPFFITEDYIGQLKKTLPLLPEERVTSYTTKFGLSEYDAHVITEERWVADYFEAVLEHTHYYKATANWIMGPFKSWVNEQGKDISAFPLSPGALAELIILIGEEKISFSVASSRLFPALLSSAPISPAALAAQLNILQDSNMDIINKLAEEVLALYPDKIEEYRTGKKGLLGLFVGEVMKRSKGKAEPRMVSQVISDKLK